jgi:hypothetical protein
MTPGWHRARALFGRGFLLDFRGLRLDARGFGGGRQRGGFTQQELFAVHANLARGRDAKADLFTTYFKHGDFNAAIDDNALSGFTSEY